MIGLIPGRLIETAAAHPRSKQMGIKHRCIKMALYNLIFSQVGYACFIPNASIGVLRQKYIQTIARLFLFEYGVVFRTSSRSASLSSLRLSRIVVNA
jgi:hypothetical protein